MRQYRPRNRITFISDIAENQSEQKHGNCLRRLKMTEKITLKIPTRQMDSEKENRSQQICRFEIVTAEKSVQNRAAKSEFFDYRRNQNRIYKRKKCFIEENRLMINKYLAQNIQPGNQSPDPAAPN